MEHTKFKNLLEENFPSGKDIFGMKVVENRVIYETRFAGVGNVSFLPEGSAETRDYMMVLEAKGAGVILAKKGTIGLVRQVRIPAQTHGWEIPLESGNAGEDPRDMAVRAAQEEFGVTIASEQLEKLPFEVTPAPNRSTDHTQPFFAELKDEKIGSFDTSELTERRFFSLSEIKDLIKNGLITEGITLASLYWYFAEKN